MCHTATNWVLTIREETKLDFRAFLCKSKAAVAHFKARGLIRVSSLNNVGVDNCVEDVK